MAGCVFGVAYKSQRQHDAVFAKKSLPLASWLPPNELLKHDARNPVSHGGLVIPEIHKGKANKVGGSMR